MGRTHLMEMKAAGMRPVAVAEIDPLRLAVATQDFPGISTFDTVDHLLERSDADIVTIITPHNTHAQIAIQCLKAGRHVVCEKPMAITTAECDAMIAAAKKKNLVITTYHNRHWDGWILRAVDQVVRKKIIGDVFRIDLRMGRRTKPQDWWRSSRTISGGILYDWGVHLLEYALQIIDSDVTEVSGYAKSGFWADHTVWKEDTNEDEACAMVRFASGAWINLNITRLNANADDTIMEIHGTTGNYVLRMAGYSIIRHEDGVTRREDGPNPQGEGFRFYKNIADHLRGKKPLIITPEWSRRMIHILDLAGRSVAEGRALRAKYA